MGQTKLVRRRPAACSLHPVATATAPRDYEDQCPAQEGKSTRGDSDPTGMTRAEMVGNEWVINGRKIWVSRVPQADFIIIMARVGSEKRHQGVTAFIADKNTQGLEVAREIPMIGGHRTYELVFDNMRLPADAILGEGGQGFAPMQLRLNVRRLQIGAWAIGLSRRALEMMCSHVKQRTTFGALLEDRQAIQWWIADSATKIHACRLMVHDAAAALDRGEDVRQAAAMVKIFGTEMVGEIVDHAIQSFGAMGVTKELPLHLMAQKARVIRIYEGPSEVHRMSVARRILASAK